MAKVRIEHWPRKWRAARWRARRFLLQELNINMSHKEAIPFIDYCFFEGFNLPPLCQW